MPLPFEQELSLDDAVLTSRRWVAAVGQRNLAAAWALTYHTLRYALAETFFDCAGALVPGAYDEGPSGHRGRELVLAIAGPGDLLWPTFSAAALSFLRANVGGSLRDLRYQSASLDRSGGGYALTAWRAPGGGVIGVRLFCDPVDGWFVDQLIADPSRSVLPTPAPLLESTVTEGAPSWRWC